MEDQKEGSPQPEADDSVDQLKNLKAEFSRKHKEQNEVLNQIQQTQLALQEALTRLSTPPTPPTQTSDEYDDLIYSNPKEYSRRLKEEAKREAMEQFRVEASSQNSIQQTITTLYNDYPELSDKDSELTKATVEILKSVADSEKANPRTYEHAVLKAAQGLDVKPKTKRPTQEEDFVSPSYSSPQARGRKVSNEAIISQNKDMAKAFGINLEDPKQKERYIQLLKSKGRI